MTKFYEIATEYQLLMDELYDEDGNERPDIKAKLEENGITSERKAIALASWIKNMEFERAAIEGIKKKINEEKDNVLAREKALNNKIDNWKEYLRVNMERTGIKQIKCPAFEINFRNNPGKAGIDDERQIPDEFFDTVRTLNKGRLLEELKCGVIVPGAHLVKTTRVDIK